MSESIIVSKLRHGFLVTLRDRDTGEGVDDVAACSTFNDLTMWLRGHFSEPAPVFNVDVRGASDETLEFLAAELDARIARSAMQTGTHQRPSQSDESSPEAGPQAQASLVGTDAGTPADREGRDEGEAASVDLPNESQAKASEDNGATDRGATPAEPVDSVTGEASRLDAGRTASATSERMDVTGGESAASNQPEAASEKVGGVTGACSALVMRREPGVDADKTGVTGGESAAALPSDAAGAEDAAAPVSIFSGLTVPQQRVMDHLRLCAGKTGSETVTIEWKTLADKARVPAGSVYVHCDALQKKGLIDLRKNGAGVAPTFTVHGALDGGKAS